MDHYIKRTDNFIQILINFDLNEVKEYALKMEEHLEEQIETFKKWFNEQTSGMSDEELNEFGEFYSDEYQNLAKSYPNLFRASTLITIYSIIEKNLKYICRHVEVKFDTKRSLKNRPYISDCSVYIGSNAGITSFFENSIEWERINGVFKGVRNAFAHNQGVIDNTEFEKLLLSEKTNFAINLINHDIFLEKECCFKLIDDALLFFESLVDSINTSYITKVNR